MLRMKMATGVLGAMAAPLFGVIWAAAAFVAGLLRTIVVGLCAGVWKLLRLAGTFLGNLAGGLLDHAGQICLSVAVVLLLFVCALGIYGKISGWKVEYDARMAATQEERAYEAAREAANDSAEDLEIAERVRAVLGGSGARALTVNGLNFEMRSILNAKSGRDEVVIIIGGVEAFIQADGKNEEPRVYRGLGSWEYMLDSVEHWIKQNEVDAKFGGLPEDCHE